MDWPQHPRSNNYHHLPKVEEQYLLRPSFFDTVLMLPFPFASIGCCLSQTSYLRFHKDQQQLELNTYCGYCCCCPHHLQIKFDQILGVEGVRQEGCQLQSQPTSKLFLFVTTKSIALTGSLGEGEIAEKARQVREVMEKCDISLV